MESDRSVPLILDINASSGISMVGMGWDDLKDRRVIADFLPRKSY